MERERDGRSARRARGLFAQHPRQAGDVAEQQEDGLLAGTRDLDVAVPGAGVLEPRHDPRVDARVIELREQFEEQRRVALIGREPERAFGTIERTQAGLTGQPARQRRVLGRDEYPMPAATVAAKLDVVALITIGDRRLLVVCGAPRLPRAGAVREERATSGIAEPQARGSRAQLSNQLRGPIVDR